MPRALRAFLGPPAPPVALLPFPPPPRRASAAGRPAARAGVPRPSWCRGARSPAGACPRRPPRARPLPVAAALPPARSPWPEGRPRTATATGRNSSGTRRRRSCWAAPGAAGVSAGPGAVGPGQEAAAIRRALQRGAPPPPAAAGLRPPARTARGGEGGLRSGPAGRFQSRLGGGGGPAYPSSGVLWGPAGGRGNATRLGVTSGGDGGEARSAPGRGMEPAAARPWRGRLVLGSPSPAAGPARPGEHRRRGSLPSQPSSALDFRVALLPPPTPRLSLDKGN